MRTLCPDCCRSNARLLTRQAGAPPHAPGGIRTPDLRFSIQHRVSTTTHCELAGWTVSSPSQAAGVQSLRIPLSPVCSASSGRARAGRLSPIQPASLLRLSARGDQVDSTASFRAGGSYLKTAALSPELRGHVRHCTVMFEDCQAGSENRVSPGLSGFPGWVIINEANRCFCESEAPRLCISPRSQYVGSRRGCYPPTN